MLKGFLKAHADIVKATDNPRVIRARGIPAGKVGIVTGGGSGHKPAFVGYVGRNMVDAVAVGNLFASPSYQAFLDAFREADQGRGVACLFGNYNGDKMNVRKAIAEAEEEGITVKTVVANDDVASAPKEHPENRRGVAGEIFMWKTGAGKAAKGGSLDEVIAAAQKAIDNTRSIGIGLTACTLPGKDGPNFEIGGESEEAAAARKAGKQLMEVGIGHHGEAGIEWAELETAAEMAKRMVDIVLPDLPFISGDEVAVLVSGLGATPVMELYVLYDEIEKLLTEKGLLIHNVYVGNYFTSLEMQGATLSVMKLDEELKELMDMPAYSMGLKQLGPDGKGVEINAPDSIRKERTSKSQGSEAAIEKRETKDDGTPKFYDIDGKQVLLGVAGIIHKNKDYLGEIDSQVGDGDHGINMDDGFSRFEKRYGDKDFSFTEGLKALGTLLEDEIGGSMGPLYGTVFTRMAKAGAGYEKFGTKELAEMLAAGRDALYKVTDARPGDKTLVDTLNAAAEALKKAAENNMELKTAVEEMKKATDSAWESTKNMTAKFGRGQYHRGRGVGYYDSGATSCRLILCAIADGINEMSK